MMADAARKAVDAGADAMYMCGARKIADITPKMIRCSKW